MATRNGALTAYEILGVHPAAPPELVNTCYWAQVRELQDRRNGDPDIDRSLFEVTEAYQRLSDPKRRASYDKAIGLSFEPLIQRKLLRARFPWRLLPWQRSRIPANAYEVLGLLPTAPQSCLDDARAIMRTVYLRLPAGSQRRYILLEMLDQSYDTLRDPAKRAELSNQVLRRKPVEAAEASEAEVEETQAAAEAPEAEVEETPASTAAPVSEAEEAPAEEAPALDPPPAPPPKARAKKRIKTAGASEAAIEAVVRRERPPAEEAAPGEEAPPGEDRWSGARRRLVAIAVAVAVFTGRAIAWAARSLFALMRWTVIMAWRGAAALARRISAARQPKPWMTRERTRPRKPSEPARDPEEVFLSRIASRVDD